MSSNVLVIPVIATVLFCVSKFVEMKFIDKELKPLKTVIRDALIVFISTLTASYVFLHMNGTIQEFMNVITETKILPSSIGGTAEIFTDTPNF
jgi:hypothetical protein